MQSLPEKVKRVFACNPIVKPVWGCVIGDLAEIEIYDKETWFRGSRKEGDAESHDYSPRVVVAMTSWTKRIQNCVGVINQLLGNTVPPDIVFLSLSMQEFPNLSEDLPRDLVHLCMTNSKVKLNWVPGPNTKSMKKVFPILPYLDDEDMIITCDDDLVVPNDLIEVRVNEFKKHDGRFAISGGTNPNWHLNKRIYDTTYNVLTATSIFSKKMLRGYDILLCDEITKTYNDDLTYTLLLLTNGYNVVPSSCISTKSGKTKRRIMFQNEISPMRLTNGYQPNEVTIKTFERRFFDTYGETLNDSLFNLVLFDSMDCAGDNGEYFYRKAKELNPNLKMTFLLSRKSKDWERLARDGFNLYPFDGPDIQLVLKNASFILWSKDVGDMSLITPYREKSVFLQHGIASDIYNFSHYMKTAINPSAKYTCCSSKWESKLISEYSGGRAVPLVVGMPRHDSLLYKDNLRNSTQKCVLVSFHWRRGKYNSDKNAFLKSKYLQDINELLNSKDIKELCESGTRVMFLPHARFMKYLKLFNVPRWVEVPVDKPF